MTSQPTDSVTGSLAAFLGSTVSAVTHPLTTGIAPVVGQVAGVAAPVVDSLSPVVSGLVDPLASTVSGVTSPVANVLAPVTAALEPVTSALGGVLQPVTASLATALQPVTDALQPVLGPVLNDLEPVLEPLSPVTSGLSPITGPLSPVLPPPLNTGPGGDMPGGSGTTGSTGGTGDTGSSGSGNSGSSGNGGDVSPPASPPPNTNPSTSAAGAEPPARPLPSQDDAGVVSSAVVSSAPGEHAPTPAAEATGARMRPADSPEVSDFAGSDASPSPLLAVPAAPGLTAPRAHTNGTATPSDQSQGAGASTTAELWTGTSATRHGDDQPPAPTPGVPDPSGYAPDAAVPGSGSTTSSGGAGQQWAAVTSTFAPPSTVGVLMPAAAQDPARACHVDDPGFSPD